MNIFEDLIKQLSSSKEISEWKKVLDDMKGTSIVESFLNDLKDLTNSDENSKMEGEPISDVMKAYYKDGKTIQYYNPLQKQWITLFKEPSWDDSITYRVKPDTNELMVLGSDDIHWLKERGGKNEEWVRKRAFDKLVNAMELQWDSSGNKLPFKKSAIWEDITISSLPDY